MPSQWHCNRDGKQLGPFSDQQLKQLAASGMLQPTDLIRKDGTEKWVPASRVKGLFPASEQVAAPQQKGASENEIPTVLPVEPVNPFQFQADADDAPEQRVEPEPDGEGEILQNYPASVGTDLNNPLDRLGILLAVLWGVATLGLVIFGFAAGDETLTVLILVVFVGGGIGAALFVRHAANTQCPKCKALWVKEYLGSRLAKREGGYETVQRHEFDSRPGREGQIKSSWLEQVHVINEVHVDLYRCGQCRHRWRGVSTQQYEG